MDLSSLADDPRYCDYWKLFGWIAARLARHYNTRNDYRAKRHKFMPDDFLGSIIIAYERCRVGFEPDKNVQFHTYFTKAVWREAKTFVAHESMADRQLALTKDDVKVLTLSESSYESEFYLYRIPEPDEDWIAAIFELCDYDRRRVWKMLTAGINRRDAGILECRYRHDQTLEEIGAVLGITKERTRQLQNRALARIRVNLNKLEAVARLFNLFDIKLPE